MDIKQNKPITYDELYAKVTKFIKKTEELDVINAAYGFALEKHSGRKRINGDDYITHPIEVANILTDLNVDYVTIACALLHETVQSKVTDSVRQICKPNCPVTVWIIQRLPPEKTPEIRYKLAVLRGYDFDTIKWSTWQSAEIMASCKIR